ncbi:RNA-directed DNA polymerase-like protein [Cucumis melo var. makuwa]|uniref:RNA-directed DNA polymerase-like protein n=1 Tax=Cucumis melo var. makuwa TaxID=1194695 RepID=A0A5D3E3L1_CUCMM|nr:RNA-directed DNA polymerase-like protein [Cucumis melo var. makuwa]
MKEVLKKKIIKWLDAGVIYPIADSQWVSSVQCVSKNGGMTVVRNKDNELIPTQTVTRRQICMDYRKLNAVAKKDYFPLPFINQMFDRLVGKKHYSFMDGYPSYNQITIAPKDQRKTMFTCFLERSVEIFMDNFSIFWGFLQRMSEQFGIRNHKIFHAGLEIDLVKIDVVSKLSLPSDLKPLRSFLDMIGSMADSSKTSTSHVSFPRDLFTVATSFLVVSPSDSTVTDFCRVGEFSRIEGRLASGMEKDLEIDKCGMLVLGLTVSLRLYWLGEMDDLGGGGSSKYFCV